jgi:hypothetical protein
MYTLATYQNYALTTYGHNLVKNCHHLAYLSRRSFSKILEYKFISSKGTQEVLALSVSYLEN